MRSRPRRPPRTTTWLRRPTGASATSSAGRREPVIGGGLRCSSSSSRHDAERGAGACRPLGTLKGGRRPRHVPAEARTDHPATPVEARHARTHWSSTSTSSPRAAASGVPSSRRWPSSPVTRCGRSLRGRSAPSRAPVALKPLRAGDRRPPDPPEGRGERLRDPARAEFHPGAAQRPAPGRSPGCEPPTVPTYDRVVPYHVSDESGRTASVAAVIVERILPNIVAGERGPRRPAPRGGVEQARPPARLRRGGGPPIRRHVTGGRGPRARPVRRGVGAP